tara:strand:- start:247 stop:567 length:321 start_codon:yes stop_codon:yes gene_type:complete
MSGQESSSFRPPYHSQLSEDFKRSIAYHTLEGFTRYNSLSPEEQTRERNAFSARKARQKKKARLTNLEERVRWLETKHQELVLENEELRRQLNEMQVNDFLIDSSD